MSIITKFSCLLVCLYPIFRAKLNKERRRKTKNPSIGLYLSRRKKFFVSQFIRSMEIEVSSSTRLDSIRVQRKTLQNLLDDCQRALHLLNLSDDVYNSDRVGQHSGSPDKEEEEELSSSSDSGDPDADKVCSYKRFLLYKI